MISFDNDNDGVDLAGDDGITVGTTIVPEFKDWYWDSTWPICGGGDAASCQNTDPIQDGSGQFYSYGGHDTFDSGTVYRFSHPINSGDVNDLSVSSLPATVGFQLWLYVYHEVGVATGVSTVYPTDSFDVARLW